MDSVWPDSYQQVKYKNQGYIHGLGEVFMARYTLRQLEAFVAVAEQGSLTSAAEKLHVSQSAISGAINNLERVFGAQLTIRRKAHGVTLTSAGKYVLDRSKGLLNAASDLELHASDAGTELRGALTLGCYRTLAPTVLAGLIDQYSRLYPLVELDFFDGPQSEIQERVLAGRLDLAVAYDLGLPAGLQRKRLYEAAPSIVLAADHPLASRPSLGLNDVADEPMILLDVNPSRENTMMMFSSAGLQPNIRFRTTDYEVTRSLVGRGMGYAILIQQPAANQTYEGRPLVVHPMTPVIRTVPVSIVWPGSVTPSQSAAAMVALASELYAEAG